VTFIDELSAHLRMMTGQCYATIEANGWRRSDELITLAWRPSSADPAYLYSVALQIGQKSNHQKVAEQAFQVSTRKDLMALRDILGRGLPALDNPWMDFTMEIRDASKTGLPRMRFEFCGHQFAGNAVTLPTILKKFDALHRHLEGVPQSTERKFKIGSHTVRARDAYDAVRIHAALAFPDAIDNPPATNLSLEVTEVLDTKPLLQALFAGA